MIIVVASQSYPAIVVAVLDDASGFAEGIGIVTETVDANTVALQLSKTGELKWQMISTLNEMSIKVSNWPKSRTVRNLKIGMMRKIIGMINDLR